MNIYNASTARANFFKMIEDTVANSEPSLVTSKAGNVVMISEEDYKSIQETLYIHSVPGLAESIIEGMNEPLENMISADEVEW